MALILKTGKKVALHNPNSLYTGGNVRFDATPTTSLYLQLDRAKKAELKARKEATEKYIRDLPFKINGEGMRIKDIAAFDEAIKDLTQFGAENINKIASGNIEAQTTLQQLFQRAKGISVQSKAAEKAMQPINSELMTGKFTPTSDMLIGIQSANNSLYEMTPEGKVKRDESGAFMPNQQYKPYDPTKYEFPINYDAVGALTRWTKNIDKVTLGEPKNIGSDRQTGQVFREEKTGFSQDGLKLMAENAATDVANNFNKTGQYFKHKFDKMEVDSPEFKMLNEAYQSVYPNDLIDSPEKLAAGEAIVYGQSLTKKDIKPVTDTELQHQRGLRRAAAGRSVINTGIGTTPSRIPKYDVFALIQDSITPAPKDILPKVKEELSKRGYSIEGDIYVIPQPSIDEKYLKELGSVNGIQIGGTRYYVVLDDNTLIGASGQKIERRASAERRFNTISASEENRGFLDDPVFPPLKKGGTSSKLKKPTKTKKTELP